MHRLTPDLLQFLLCLFLPLPIRNLLRLGPGGDPWHGHRAGSCLQHGLGGSRGAGTAPGMPLTVTAPLHCFCSHSSRDCPTPSSL